MQTFPRHRYVNRVAADVLQMWNRPMPSSQSYFSEVKALTYKGVITSILHFSLTICYFLIKLNLI